MHDRRRPLTLRNDPAADQGGQTRDLVCRGVVVRAATADEATRSVEVVMSTEAPVTVYDWERGIIDEVLVADGGTYPAQMPLLANHSRYSLDDVLGSVREMRRDGANWVGRMYFAEGDDAATRVWNKVKQRHITDVSIGYRSTEYVDIPAGQTATVGGRSFTATGQRALRVTTRYEPKELSVVPIGADRNAKVRQQQPPGDSGKGLSMKPQLRKYLESLGLRTDASDAQAQAFLAALGGDAKTRADAIAADKLTLEEALRQSQRNEPPAGDNTRTAPLIAGVPTLVEPVNQETLRAEGARLERERQTNIRNLATADTTPELVTRAIDAGWTVENASREFLRELRERRQPSVGADAGRAGAPGGIVSNHERDCTRASLGLALFMRAGGQGDDRLKAAVDLLNQQRVRGGLEPLKLDNVAQQAQRYDDMSLFDVCREAIRIDGNRQQPHGRDETIRAAVSGGSLTQIFTTSVNAMVLVGYEEEADTTVWCFETDVADFKTNTDIRFNVNAGLKKVGRGGTAEHATSDDSAETYKIARYGKQWAADEQDIIDDSMNAFANVAPEFGAAAARLRPDLVYAMVLANPTMADTGAVFNSTALTTAGGHANYAASGTADALGAAMTAGSLQAAILAMGKQYRGAGRSKVQLNIRPQYLVVPTDLKFTAEILLSSAERFKDSTDGTYNPLRGTLQPIVEARLGAVGVTDPDSGTAYTGTAVNYFLFARAGLSAKVAYRRGTNRSPVLRSYALEKGQWGIGFDINHDIGCKFTEFRGAFMAKGSA